ncbi:hypothetical protein BH20CHL4_BH20CHL4_14250 [soil metagenome]
MASQESDFINITEAATILGINRVTVWRWIRDGRLPASRIGHRTTRIHRDDLAKLLQPYNRPTGTPHAAPNLEQQLQPGESWPAESHQPEVPNGQTSLTAGYGETNGSFSTVGPGPGEASQTEMLIDAVTSQLQRGSSQGGNVETQQILQALKAIAGQTASYALLIERLLDGQPLHGAELASGQLRGGMNVFVEPDDSQGPKLGDRLADQSNGSIATAVAPVRLTQVLTSLLENATKFEPHDHPIDVVISLAAPELVELSIPDRGVDLPPGQRIQNLERFYRDQSESRLSGLGLGQLICQQIVDLHGGEIRAEELPEGGRFVVRLPVVKGEVSAAIDPECESDS